MIFVTFHYLFGGAVSSFSEIVIEFDCECFSVGDRRKSRNFFFTEDEAPRRASNHGPFYGNYGNK